MPEPNTWREVLATLDEHVPVAGRRVGVQEYGQPNPHLVAGLEARGAQVRTVKVYHWDLPEDTAPLEANVRAIAAGERDVVLFTSSQQVVNLLGMAERLELGRRQCVGSCSGWSWPRSARRPARRCASCSCRSIWSRSIRRWGTWWLAAAERAAELC